MTSVNHVFGWSERKDCEKTTQTQKEQHAEWIFMENIYEDEFNIFFSSHTNNTMGKGRKSIGMINNKSHIRSHVDLYPKKKNIYFSPST